MAKKVIKKDDVAQKGLFDNVTLGAKEAKAQIEMLTQAMKILQQNAKKIKGAVGGAGKQDTQGMKDFDTQAKKANQTAKAKLSIDKKILHEKKKLQQMTGQQNKEIRTTIQATTRLNQEQRKSLGTLQKLEFHNTKLRATRAKLNLETKRGKRILQQINAQLDKNNAKIRSSGDAMKKQRLNVGNYGSAVGKLKGALGQLGLAFGVFALIRNSFNVIKNFEQSQANLASVLGVNRSEMKLLTDQAKELGATTTFTASQVAELQKELAKLGFDQTEIEGMTEGVLLLAEATGTELARAAEVTGATMRGFGLEAHETQRVVDVMAKSFSSSSLDMEKFANSMKSVAPVANLAGYSIEETTALIGTLTDRGIDASTAGTGLRNMFLLAGKNGLTLDQALEKINNSADKTKESFALFGQRGATLGVILAENGEATKTLTEKLDDAEGAAKKMAETQRDTLGGAIALLQSAWEGLILKMDEAGGVGEMLKTGIQFLANNLETIVGVIGTAVKMFISYKVVVLSSAMANKLMGTSFMRLAKAGKGVKGVMRGIKTSFAKLGQALKANIFGIIILALYKLYEAFNVVKTAGQQMKEIQDKINTSHDDAQVQLEKERVELDMLVESIKTTTAGTLAREEAIKKLNERYGTNLQNIKDEKKFLAELDIVQKNILKNIEAKIDLMQTEQEFAILGEELVRTEIEQGRLRTEMANAWGQNAFTEFLQGFGDYENTKGVLQDQFKENEKLIAQLKKKKATARAELKKLLNVQALEAEAQKKVVTTDPTDPADPSTPTPTAPKPYVDLIRATEDAKIAIIEDAEKRARDARQITFDRLIADTEKKKTHTKDFDAWKIAQENLLTSDLKKIEVDAEKERDKARDVSKQALKQSEIDNQKILINGIEKGSLAQIEAQEDLDELLIEQIKQNSEIQLKEVEEKSGEELRIKSQTQLAIDQVEIDAEERRKAYREKVFADKQTEWTKEEEKYRLTLLQNKDLTNDQVDKMMNDFQIEQLEKQIAFMKANYPQMEAEILEMETTLAEKKRTIWDKEADATANAEKEKLELQKKAIDLATEMFTKSIDKKIEKLDEEIEAHKRLAGELKDLARDGNINAQESLAEENRLIAEAEQEKAEQEKRKQRVLMVSAFIKTYLSAIDSGEAPADALTQALTSQALLDGIVNNLGSFFEGTEDTGTVGNSLDSNGGRLAVLHNNERVITAKQNKMIGGVTNDEVARVMEQKRLGQLVDGNQTVVGFENILLLEQLNSVGEKLDKVNKTIENKPEMNIELGAITSKTMEIIESRKKGKIKTVSTFKVKPQ